MKDNFLNGNVGIANDNIVDKTDRLNVKTVQQAVCGLLSSSSLNFKEVLMKC